LTRFWGLAYRSAPAVAFFLGPARVPMPGVAGALTSLGTRAPWQFEPPDKSRATSKQDKNTLAHGERQAAQCQNRIIRLKARRDLIPRVAHRISSFLRGSKNQFEKFRGQVDRKHHNRKAANQSDRRQLELRTAIQVVRLQEAYLSTLVVVIGFPDTFFGRSFLRMLRMCKLSKVLASFVGSDKNTLCIFLLCSLTK
jgi:hypothetical protein